MEEEKSHLSHGNDRTFNWILSLWMHDLIDVLIGAFFLQFLSFLYILIAVLVSKKVMIGNFDRFAG